jgi:hypothetical protein
MCIKAPERRHTCIPHFTLASVGRNHKEAVCVLMNVRLRCVVMSHVTWELPNGVCHVNVVDQETWQPGHRRRRFFHIIPRNGKRELSYTSVS